MNIQLSDHFTFKRLFRFVMPSITMMVFTSIYSVVDGLFISNFAGKTDFASINLIMPFIIILSGTGYMVEIGGVALVSKTLGEGKRDLANRYFSMLIIFDILLGLFLTIIGLIFVRPISILFGATEDMIEACVIYGRIVIAFTICFMMQNIFQSFLIAAERPKLGLLATIIAGLMNIFLDFLFVGVFKWGIVGAAFATGISQTVGGIIPFVFFLRPNSTPLRLRIVKLEFKPIIKSCLNGISELLGNMSTSIVGIVYNIQLLKYIGENGVATFGVIMYVQFLFVAMYIGYYIGACPIISYDYGANNIYELKNMFKKSMIINICMGLIMCLSGVFLSGLIAKVFVGYDVELFKLTKYAFRIYAFSFLTSGVNMFISALFTALNNGLISGILSTLRSLVFQICFVIIFPIMFGVNSIWYAIIASEICSLAFSILFIVSNRKRYNYY